MTDINGGKLIADVLRKQGVQFLFTLCGGHISPILVESQRAGIRVVDMRDEKSAVFAADAVARMVKVGRRYSPNPDRVAELDSKYAVFKEIVRLTSQIPPIERARNGEGSREVRHA